MSRDVRGENELERMRKLNEIEMLIWQRRTETQLQAARRPGMNLEIRTAQKAGRDAAVLTGICATRSAAAVVIPIRWMPVQSWTKIIRVEKSLRP